MQTKKWYQSKTIWTNIIVAILAILAVFNQDVLIQLGFNSTRFLALLGIITTILNIILRFLSTQMIVVGNKVKTDSDTPIDNDTEHPSQPPVHA